MHRLSIDIETFSSADLSKTGVYRYAEDPNFTVLLFGYALDDGDVHVVDIAQGERMPPEIIAALTDESVVKFAFNANFERVCLSRYLGLPTGEYLDPAQWRCSMIWSAYLGLPLSLAGVGAALDLDKQKLSEGKDIIRYFCQPCAPTKANGGRERNRPADAPDKWTLFKTYNARDVETERAIQERLKRFPVPQTVWEEYWLDQEINDRGIRVDMSLVQNAIRMDELSRNELSEKMRALTALQNPNSVAQMKTWLAENGLETDSLGKKQVAALLKDAPEGLADVLALRRQLAKSSVKKYQAMANTACSDNRVRGCFQFYGANRSGRWAGRNVQLQNLPQNHMEDLADARELVRAGAYEDLKARYASVPDVLSELIRTALVPYEDGKFIVSDFSAIEARVIAWIAGEQWRLDVFQNGGDIYCASASQMFRVPVEKHGVNGHLRQKGKIAELALGYGGSVGALKAMGALDMGLTEDELKPLVDAWRTANPRIVRLWWDVDEAVQTAVRERTSTESHDIEFAWKSSMLFITLPSGRRLAYVKPRIGENQFGSPAVTYMGLNSVKKWDRIESYGPKFVENIVQAISRDILCHAMRTLRCCNIVAHVHDEIIIEADPRMSLSAVCEQMGRTPEWAPGLVLRADGYETAFYKKD